MLLDDGNVKRAQKHSLRGASRMFRVAPAECITVHFHFHAATTIGTILFEQYSPETRFSSVCLLPMGDAGVG